MRFEVLIADRLLDYREDLRSLPVVVLEVDADDQLVDISNRALAEHGADWAYPYRNFVTGPDEEGRRLRTGYLVAYVADDGVLSWTGRGQNTLEGVRVSDVVRTQQRGLFNGDPAALLIERPTGGDGGFFPEFDDVIRWLIALGGIRGGLALLQDAANALADVIERSKEAWEARGARAWSLFPVVIEHGEWDYRELAGLLDVSYDTVVTLLERLGFVQDVSEPTIYRISDDEVAALREKLEDEVLQVDPRASARWLWEVQGKPADWVPPM